MGGGPEPQQRVVYIYIDIYCICGERIETHDSKIVSTVKGGGKMRESTPAEK